MFVVTKKRIPTVLLSHVAYSYSWVSGWDSMHKSLLVAFIFEVSNGAIETLF